MEPKSQVWRGEGGRAIKEKCRRRFGTRNFRPANLEIIMGSSKLTATFSWPRPTPQRGPWVRGVWTCWAAPLSLLPGMNMCPWLMLVWSVIRASNERKCSKVFYRECVGAVTEGKRKKKSELDRFISFQFDVCQRLWRRWIVLPHVAFAPMQGVSARAKALSLGAGPDTETPCLISPLCFATGDEFLRPSWSTCFARNC